MKRTKMLYLVVVLSACLFTLWGCPKKAEVSAVPEAEKVEAAPTPTAEADVSAEEAKERAAAAAGGLQAVYFDYDRSFIRGDAREAMEANAEWLKANPKAKIRIEGNCDERGTKEYNVALGQRRAASAKKYLTDLGISANRISLISYGKEKSVCADQTEQCWQKNRHDDFVVSNQ